MLLDKFTIHVASAPQEHDEIVRFQLYEPTMFLGVKGS